MRPNFEPSRTPCSESAWAKRIEHKLDRLGFHSTQRMLVLDRLERLVIGRTMSISTPSAVLPPEEETNTPPAKKKGWLRATLQYSKPVIGYAIEKLLPWGMGIIGPVLLGLWASGREGVQILWGWILWGWVWLVG